MKDEVKETIETRVALSWIFEVFFRHYNVGFGRIMHGIELLTYGGENCEDVWRW